MTLRSHQSASRLAALAASLLLATGCASLDGGSAPVAAASNAEAAKPVETKAAASKDESEARKKDREFDYARIQLDLAKMAAESARGAAKAAQGAAERELASAKTSRDHFKKVTVALELDERALSVDRAQQFVLESEQELKELEAMYAGEKFAETTKELVLSRGRSRLEMAKRDLELSQRRLDELKTHEHKQREKELGERVTKAQQAFDDAKAAARRTDLEQRLAVLRAEHAFEDAAREAPERARALIEEREKAKESKEQSKDGAGAGAEAPAKAEGAPAPAQKP
ncbi:MAG: hypothetical protein NTV21_14105 [Planctomycetota bacterium]|nr:hypothetical protein [Planctomycetota bacterium]